jgi:hypothetical protein
MDSARHDCVNPLTNLPKLVRSKKYFDEIKLDLKELFTKNWITSLHGIVIAGLLLSKIWLPPVYQDKINDTIMILTATGLFSAKDFNQHSTVSETQEATREELNK